MNSVKYDDKLASDMYELAEQLFPICRSLTGDGVRDSLKIIKKQYPQMKIYEVPSGTQVFDWNIPKEWNIKDAYIKDENGNKIVDFKVNNLHVMGYSAPIDKIVSLDELQKYLYSLPDQPDWIPYVTSYYKERSGFSISHKKRLSLKDGKYKMFIDSELKAGNLTYGEIIIRGETDEEIFLSTYICHPSMANNELSGPCVTIQLAKFIKSLPNRKYTYRIVFVPETIGSITYISKNLEELKNKVIAGFNITCVGDERAYSYLSSRYGNTLADKVAQNVLSNIDSNYKKYSYLSRGSDERQYCSAGVDLPMCSIMRSKYGTYPEYHTSADDMKLITPKGLYGAYNVYCQCISALENNNYYKSTCICEPQLGKRGLYPTISQKNSAAAEVRTMMNVLAYADGSNDLIDISNIIGVAVEDIIPIIGKLCNNGIIKC